MKLNKTLAKDIDNIVTHDVPKFASPFVKNFTPQQTNHFLDDTERELIATFNTYGVSYNEETLQAAMVALIWSTSATHSMFANGNNPVAPENDNPHGHAVHGGLVAIQAVAHAIENYGE